MIKLLAISDLTVRGVTVNRLYSLECLAENGHDISVRIRHKYPTSWDLDWCDCVFFLRAIGVDDLNFIKECKVNGKKIWIDSDDDCLNIPLDHSGYFFFQDSNLRTAYKEIHKIADYVTFSTKTLSQTIKTKEHSIIPCSYPDNIVNSFTEPADIAKTILWRGTESHERSLDEFAPAIIEVLRNHPEWKIEFFGCKPWKILQNISNPWCCHPFYDVTELLKKIHETRASVHIVPRSDNTFTKSRSSIAYVEAAFAGAVTVAPDWEEWKWPGILNYTNDFAAKFEHAITIAGTEEHTKLWNKSVKYIKKERTWSSTNKKHAAVLRKILESNK